MLCVWWRHLCPGRRLEVPGLRASITRGGVAEVGAVRRVRQVAPPAVAHCSAELPARWTCDMNVWDADRAACAVDAEARPEGSAFRARGGGIIFDGGG